MSRDLRQFAQWPRPREAVSAPESSFGYLVQVATDPEPAYMPTVDPSEATHIHAYDAEVDGIRVVPIGSDAGGVIMRRIGNESYRITRI